MRGLRQVQSVRHFRYQKGLHSRLEVRYHSPDPGIFNSIPERWLDKYVQLHLERVMWTSQVWIDGHLVGTQDSLVAPHMYDLGKLVPGPHSLTIRMEKSLGSAKSKCHSDRFKVWGILPCE